MVLLLERGSAAVGKPAARPLPWAVGVVIAVAVAIAYFLAAKLGLTFLAKPSDVAVFWPAAGVASGALIVAGSRGRWPVLAGVIAATVCANLLSDRNIWTSGLSAVANATEAAIVAGLIARAYGSSFELNTLPRVIGLFVATIAGTAVSGIVGTMGFVRFQGVTVSVPTIWLHWFASDSLGTLTVAPLVIGLASLIRKAPTAREVVESALALAVVCGLCAFLVFLPNKPWTVELATISLCPLFVWIAARLPPGITAVATFVCAITVVVTTTFAVGVFGDSDLPLDQRIRAAQASILAISFGALVLTALFSEQRLQQVALLDRDARLQEALRAGGVMAFEWDLAADRVRHSQNAVLVLGFGSKNVLSGSEMLGRVHPEDRPHMTACLHGISPDKPSYSVTFRYQRAAGDGEVWLEQVGTAEFDSHGVPTRIQGLTTDITERKRFEEEISRAQRLAERADRAKSVFLAAASHDLRQPLQTLKFLQGSLEQQHPDGEKQPLIADIGHSIDTMSSMLSSLLDINRLESGNLSPSKSDFAVSEIFSSVASDLLRPLREKGLQWRVVPSDVVVHSDKRMLEEMIRNLMSNAIRYTDRGKILLGCRRAKGKLRIEVWDTGIGIPGDQLPHIFEEDYCDTERGGFGLGLAIVRRLGELLDHRVDVRSAPGKGTAFSIEVPRGQPRADLSRAVRTSDSEGGAFAGTVLVIEDDPSVRSALTRMLKLSGIGAIGVATTSDAAALIEHKGIRPDLVLCDFNLPGPMNGVESIGALRAALAWNLPAIVMTGDTREKTMEVVAAHGLSVLVKPFAANELIALINRLCGSSACADRDRSAGPIGQMAARLVH